MCPCSLSLPGLYVIVVEVHKWKRKGGVGATVPPSTRLMLQIKFVFLQGEGSQGSRFCVCLQY